MPWNKPRRKNSLPISLSLRTEHTGCCRSAPLTTCKQVRCITSSKRVSRYNTGGAMTVAITRQRSGFLAHFSLLWPTWVVSKGLIHTNLPSGIYTSVPGGRRCPRCARDESQCLKERKKGKKRWEVFTHWLPFPSVRVICLRECWIHVLHYTNAADSRTWIHTKAQGFREDCVEIFQKLT